MGLTDKYPYTNYAGINLDYYIKQVNDVKGINFKVDGNELQLVDGSGKVLSSVPYPTNPGSVIMADLFDSDETRHRTLFYDLVTMEEDGHKSYKSNYSLSDIQLLRTSGSIVYLKHHQYWDNASDHVDCIKSLADGTIHIAENNSYIAFVWIQQYDDGEANKVYYNQFMIKNGTTGYIDIYKTASYVIATLE